MNKVALIKLGCRFALNSKSKTGGVQEAISIIDMLNTSGIQVDVYDKILNGDEQSTNKLLNIYNIDKVETGLFDEALPYYETVNDQGYDALIVLNGNVTYFGGEDRSHETKKLIILNEFIGPVFYIIGDFNLILKNNEKSLLAKKWVHNYDGHKLATDRDDIIYISQGKETQKLFDHLNNSKSSSTVHVKDVKYFPIEKFPWFAMDYGKFNENPEFDLIYGGNFRGGSREADMIKFLFGYPDDVKVRVFGAISEKQFNKSKVGNLRSPEFNSKSYDYLTYCAELNKSKAIIIIGDGKDKLYNKTAARVFESVRMGLVLFIDESLDHNKTVFNNDELKEFCYVNSRDDVIDKLEKLKDTEFRKHIVDLERQDLDCTYKDYCDQFKELLESEI